MQAPFIVFSALLSCLTGALVACSDTSHASPPAASSSFVLDKGRITLPADSTLRHEITVQPVDALAAATIASYPATIDGDPARSVTIVAPVTGRILSLRVGLGDHVHKDQVLATLVSGDAAQAYADRARATDALALARRQLTRAVDVQAAGGNAGKDVEAARSAQAQAEAENTRTLTRLQALQGKTGNSGPGHELALVAPFDGSITTLGIAVGSVVNDLTAPLMTVTNLDRVWATADIPEDAIGHVSAGQTASVSLSAYPGLVLQGKVESINAVLDNDTRRVKARIALDNPGERLKPNMYATVSLRRPSASLVLVPQTALIMDNDRVSVFVERGPWQFERRDIEIGTDQGDDTQVLHGLAANDRIVVRGGVLLQ